MKHYIHSLDIARKFKTKRPHSLNVRSDHDGEFENHGFQSFCNEHGYGHNFFAPRTPLQKGIVKRKNRTLKEMARTMLCENNLPNFFLKRSNKHCRLCHQ